MEQEQLDRITALADAIEKAGGSIGFKPTARTVYAIFHALAGQEVVFVAADLARSSVRVAGTVVVFTAELVAFVTLDGAAEARVMSGDEDEATDGPIRIEVLPRARLVSLELWVRAKGERESASPAFPRSAEVRAQYGSHSAVLTKLQTSISVEDAYRQLLADLATARS